MRQARGVALTEHHADMEGSADADDGVRLNAKRHLTREQACAGRRPQSSATAACCPSRAPGAAPAAALVWAPAKQTMSSMLSPSKYAMEAAWQSRPVVATQTSPLSCEA